MTGPLWLRLLAPGLAGIVLLSGACFGANPAVERLGSTEQAVRDEAAKELRKKDPKPDPERWKPLLKRLRNGMSWSECLATLGPATNKLVTTYRQMWFFTKDCRLDDFHILRLKFHAKADGTPDSAYSLCEVELLDDVRYVWVYPPKGFTGTWTTYFVNGQKSHEFGYRAGAYYGTCTAYAPNGAVVTHHYYGEKGLTGEAEAGTTGGSQPFRSDTNQTSSAAGSRR